MARRRRVSPAVSAVLTGTRAARTVSGPATHAAHHAGRAAPAVHVASHAATHPAAAHAAATVVHLAQRIPNADARAHFLHALLPGVVPPPKSSLTHELVDQIESHIRSAGQALHKEASQVASHVGTQTANQVARDTRPRRVRATEAKSAAATAAAAKPPDSSGPFGISIPSPAAVLKDLGSAAGGLVSGGGTAVSAEQQAEHRARLAPTEPVITGHGVEVSKGAKVSSPQGQLALALAPLPFGKARLAEEGASELARALTVERDLAAGEKGLSASERAAKTRSISDALRAFERSSRSPTSRIAGRAAQFARDTRAGRAVESRAGRLAGRVAESPLGRGAARVGRTRGVQAAGRSARFGARHPFVSTTGAGIAAQVPATLTTGDPRQLTKALEGQGVVAGALGSVGDVAKGVPIAGNALSDVLNLPAQVIPTGYELGAAGVEALQGDTSRFERLKQGYLSTDFLPALLRGDVGEALHRAGEHPLYAALEARGLGAAASRGAGALTTTAGEMRPPRYVQGGEVASGRIAEVGRGRYRGEPVLRDPLAEARSGIVYSRRAAKNAIQKAIDRRALERRPGPLVEDVRGRPIRSTQATPREANRISQSATVSQMAVNRATDLAGRSTVEHVMEEVKPPRGNANVVKLMVERVLRNPDTARQDLTAYRKLLVSQRTALDSRAKLTANAEAISNIDGALKNFDPAAIGHATDAFLKLQSPVEREMIERGLLAHEQVARRHIQAYAVAHMDARYGHTDAAAARIQELEAQRINDGGPGLEPAEKAELTRLRGQTQMVGPDGQALPDSVIEDHMRQAGVPFEGNTAQAGYVSNVPGGADRPSSFFRGYEERNTLSRKPFTGQSIRQGTAATTWENAIGTLQRQRTAVGSVKAFDEMGRQLGIGIRDENGKVQPFTDPSEARAAIDTPADYNLELPPVKGGYDILQVGGPFSTLRELEAARRFGPEGAAQQIAAETGEDPKVIQRRTSELAARLPEGISQEVESEILSEMTAARALAAADPKGRTYIIPRVAKERIAEAFQRRTSGERALQAVTGIQKRVWLPTNPGWFLGNAFDNYAIRTLGTGITPDDIFRGRELAQFILRHHGEEDGNVILQRLIEEGMFGSVRQIQPKRMAESFEADRYIGPVARAGAALARAPYGPKLAVDLFRKYTNVMFRIEQHAFEETPRYGELSRTARKVLGESKLSWGRALKHQTDAVNEFVTKGLRNTYVQRAFAAEVDKTFGNWIRLKPTERRFLSAVAPFWTWARAATRFVFLTMPVDHPIITGMLAGAATMSENERKAWGLDKRAAIPVPDFLQGAIPAPLPGFLGGGNYIPTSNLSSYGFFATFPHSYASMLLPQFQSPILSAFGVDWKGDKLTMSDGRPADDPTRIGLAIGTLGESFIPFFNQARAGLSRGPLAGVSPIHGYPTDYVTYLRDKQNQQSIDVPIKGVPQLPTPGSSSSSPSSDPWGLTPSSSGADPWGLSSKSSSSDPWGLNP